MILQKSIKKLEHLLLDDYENIVRQGREHREYDRVPHHAPYTLLTNMVALCSRVVQHMELLLIHTQPIVCYFTTIRHAFINT